MSDTERKYFVTKTPEGPWDAIVVGSGMGGMIAAALLTRAGKRVLVLEQHYIPGGFTHAFKRKKWSWDVGVHTVGEVTEHTVTGRLLSFLTDGKLRWSSLGSPYDEFHFPDGYEIAFPDDREAFRALLHERFPNETLAIDQYLAGVRDAVASMGSDLITRIMPQWLGRLAEPVIARRARRLHRTTTAEALARITDDERLKTVLTAQWGYYGTPPSRSPFIMQALVAKHYLFGGFYPEGGAGSIAETLLRPLVAAGGAVRIRAEVDEIVIQRGRARGVRLTDGETIDAPVVISDAGALATVQKLLPQAERSKRWARSIAAIKPSAPHVCLYLGFKGDIRAAGAGSANKWFYDTWDHEEAERRLTATGRYPILYVSFPSLKDPHHDPGPEQLHTGEVVTFVPWEKFAEWKDGRWRKRGDDYEALKAEIAAGLRSQLLEHMPDLEPLIAFEEVSTPVSTYHFARSSQGAVYGLEHTPERFTNPHLRPRTPVRGLFLAGCDIASAGVMGAALGGVEAAAAVAPRQTLKLLMPLVRRGKG